MDRFQGKAFAHQVIYEGDVLTTNFYEFIKTGESDISFNQLEKQEGEYEIWHYFPIHGQKEEVKINNINAHKTIYRKNIFFESQKEYRIVLPYERIEDGCIYKIEPFQAELIRLDDLIK